jgi:signal peptidase I
MISEDKTRNNWTQFLKNRTFGTKDTKPQTKMSRFLNNMWTVVVGLAAILLILKIVWVQQVNVVGQSMEPNYHGGEKLLLSKIANDIPRGEVVSFYEFLDAAKNATIITKAFPSINDNDNRFLLKRVIGLPGEEIEIVGSKVIIYNNDHKDGMVLIEDYISADVKSQMEKGCIRAYGSDYISRTKIPDNHYYLMGDNRCESLDSRDAKHGPFDREQLFGTLIVRYWPFNLWQKFEAPDIKTINVDEATQQKLDQRRSDYAKKAN